ncbi:MAG: helix-turn-helix domain-containing protein [Streptococcaceae bacterium]|jgi:hypothetical protein|nr:helix-turn-helix domain-containing protein [Streptococcaceae bacterium]
MNKEEFLKIYPQAKPVLTSKEQPDQLILRIEERLYVLNKNELTKNEIKLLTTLFKAKIYPKSPWLKFLETGTLPPLETKFRLIQFTTTQEINEYIEVVQEMIPSVLSIIQLSDKQGLLIEEYTKNTFSLQEYQEIFLALDADLLAETKAYVGNIYHTNEWKVEFFLNEQEKFMQFLHLNTGTRVQSLSGIFLTSEVSQIIDKNPSLLHLKGQLIKNHENIELIRALWKHQGSLTQTAKELYLHRNSLQYKLKKFEAEFAFSLKDMNDLLLCYVLVV